MSSMFANRIMDTQEIRIEGYCAKPSELGSIGGGGRWIPNGAVVHLAAQVNELADKLAIAKSALVELSVLGNEPYLGNSHGNVIAQAALYKINLKGN